MRAATEDDWDLLARAPDDEPALGRLFERHRHYVYRLAWGLLNEAHAADDVVQEVFLKMRTGRLKAVPRAKFTTWLSRVAVNTAREQARARHRRWGEPLADHTGDEAADVGAPMDRVDTLRDLGAALSRLPERQREVVVLRFLEGFDTRETAEIIGCREGTVKAHLHRATATLRRFLGDP